jgi:hypothetical protein
MKCYGLLAPKAKAFGTKVFGYGLLAPKAKAFGYGNEMFKVRAIHD